MQLSASTGHTITGKTPNPYTDLGNRGLIAIPALLLLVSVIYFHGLYAKIAVSIVHILCVREIINAVSAVASPIRGLSYGFAAALFPAYEFLGGQSAVSGLLTLCLLLVFLVLIICQRDIMDGLYTILTLLYPGMLFASFYDLLSVPNQRISQFLLIMTFGCAIVADTFAYLGGSAFGRHKLIERVSPHKTVEGAICGFVSGALFVFIFGSHFQSVFNVHLNKIHYIAWGALLSFFSQVGDLSASYLKRWFGIKDFGKILGPHGGMLDRLDSMLFVAPIASLFSIIYL